MSSELDAEPKDAGWLQNTLRGYLNEGELWAGRIGRRYGWWGYEKGAPLDSVKKADLDVRLAGDVANAVAAYAVCFLFDDAYPGTR